MNSLADQFATLEHSVTETGADVFASKELGESSHQIAKDMDGNPSLLLNVLPSGRPTPSLMLKNFRVDYNLTCKITSSTNEIATGTYSVVRCLSSEPQTHTIFLDSMDMVLDKLRIGATDVQLSELISQICNLFVAMSKPASRPVQALWAELFFIRESPDPMQSIRAWRQSDSDSFDFLFDTLRVDVKSSSNKRRTHFFSFDQLNPPSNSLAVVASVFTDRVANGLSLGTLWESAKSHVKASPELLSRVDEVCLNSLGSSWKEATTVTFDEQLASDSLRYFSAEEIPRIEGPLPIGVSELRFKSDLSTAEPMPNLFG